MMIVGIVILGAGVNALIILACALIVKVIYRMNTFQQVSAVTLKAVTLCFPSIWSRWKSKSLQSLISLPIRQQISSTLAIQTQSRPI